MVKNKKLSKSSVSIIVLALLLIASLVLGMTGAWFTDNQKADRTDTLTFGTVKVTPSLASQQAVAHANVVPGDEIEMEGSVLLESTVDTYVYIKAEAYLAKTVEGVQKWYKVYDAAENGNELIHLLVEYDAAELEAPYVSHWAQQTLPNPGYDANAQEAPANQQRLEKAGFYLVTVQDIANDDKTLDVTVTLRLDGAEFLNIAYLEHVGPQAELDAERVGENFNGASGYEIYVAISVKSVQAKNLTAGANPTVADTAWAILSGDVQAQEAVAA